MMATYFHGNSDIQGSGDGLQTLILMNPAYGGYSDTGGSNFAFLNSNSAGSTVNLSHVPPSETLHFTATTSASAASPQDSHHQDISELNTFRNIQYSFYNPPIDIRAAREVTRPQQGLSLSLSSQQSRSQPLLTAEDVRVPAESPSSGSGISTVLLGSKYLKAAQELLDEVVNVGRGAKIASEYSAKGDNEQPKDTGESFRAAAGVPAGGGQGGTELTTAEKQEIQMKKAKLVNMLDEIDQRYRQYHHQIQIIISLFEQVAGAGSAKTYTSLALQTISKQFRCLKDAILAQIRVASRHFGKEDDLGRKIEASELKYVDNQIRQQRALQQLGMIQQNAWRPQRGLPERSVSVLRAWLFEHFLHPYPKDSDKTMLAKQTGLTKSQVSNWFINARVRLWKPMVEEMYIEEMKQHEANGSDNRAATKTEQNEVSTSKPTETKPHNKSFTSKQDSPIDQNIIPAFNLIGSSEMETITQSMNMEPKQEIEGFTLTGTSTNFVGGFGSYPMVEFERFGSEQFQESYSGNGVSLTLGLPHCENVSISSAHETFLPNQSIGKDVEIVEANDFSEYADISIQNRKSFAAQFVT